MKLTQERLKELLYYEPETGVFTWRVSFNSITAGQEAGTIKQEGYIRIVVDRHSYYAHRLAFLYMEGVFPSKGVDHKYGRKTDNRWDKSRKASQTINSHNQKILITNSSGFPGVTWDNVNKKWRSQIWVKGKHVCLGRYNSILNAALARLTLEQQCPLWCCSPRAVLLKAIKQIWPKFKGGSYGE